jgi:hypothetical protein
VIAFQSSPIRNRPDAFMVAIILAWACFARQTPNEKAMGHFNHKV